MLIYDIIAISAVIVISRHDIFYFWRKNCMTSKFSNLRASSNQVTQSEYDYLKSQAEAAEEKVMKLQEELQLVAQDGTDDENPAFAQVKASLAAATSEWNKLKEQREKSIEAERTVTLTNISDPASLPPHALNIDYEKQLIDTGVIAKRDPVQAIREADELAVRKKRRIANFMLEDIDEGCSKR